MSGARAILATMMTTHESDRLDPRIAQFKQEMFSLATGIANAANGIGISYPAWDLKVREQVNKNLDPAISNVARLPDELARTIMQVAGAHLHQIGQLMRSEFTTPATVAPLARSVLENIALLLYINRPEDTPEERTVRAARAIKYGMNRDKVHTMPGLVELYDGLNTVLQRYTKKNVIPELKTEDVKYDAMVKETLGELIGEDLYGELCSYTHHNAWRAFYQFLAANENPTQLELDSLRFAYRASMAVAGGALVLSNYRDTEGSEKYLSHINESIALVQALGQRIESYVDSLVVGPAPS